MSLNLEDLAPEIRGVVDQFVAAERLRADNLATENRMLREMVRLLQRQKYGPKSEQLSDRQLQLLESEPCVVEEEVDKEAALAARDPKNREPRVPRRDRKHPGRVESIFNALGKVEASHLLDRSLVDFAAIRATGREEPGGDIAFDVDPALEAAADAAAAVTIRLARS